MIVTFIDTSFVCHLILIFKLFIFLVKQNGDDLCKLDDQKDCKFRVKRGLFKSIADDKLKNEDNSIYIEMGKIYDEFGLKTNEINPTMQPAINQLVVALIEERSEKKLKKD